MNRSTPITIEERFRGPPNSGNGGYVAGVLARDIPGPASAMLRAPIPLATPLSLQGDVGGVKLLGEDERLIAEAQSAPASDLPDAPAPPTLQAAREAGQGYIGLTQAFHPICLTCASSLEPHEGLRVFVGPLEGAPKGHLAGVWTVDPAFCGEDGRARSEFVWAAMDCPGFYAWVDVEGRHGALLGTMQAEVIERPRAGEETIVLAWPIERSGRKEIAGVALFSADGRPLARARQIWIGRDPARATGWPAPPPAG